MAGGGDLLGAMKDDIFETYPTLVVNLKTIPGLSGVTVEGNALVIGAMTMLGDLSQDSLALQYAPALAAAAGMCASPALRENTTVGGNLCQLPRCWYFRKLNNRFDCARKGGETCFALNGDNRYHSVFGACTFSDKNGHKRACIAVNQGELAPVLAALDASVVTTERTIPVEAFFAADVMTATVLHPGEIVTAVSIPLVPARRAVYKRFSFRKSIDFPVINLSVSVDADRHYRICFGGVAPLPHRALEAEALLDGKTLTPELCIAAGDAALKGGRPLEANAYKLQLMRTLLKRELEGMMET